MGGSEYAHTHQKAEGSRSLKVAYGLISQALPRESRETGVLSARKSAPLIAYSAARGPVRTRNPIGGLPISFRPLGGFPIARWLTLGMYPTLEALSIGPRGIEPRRAAHKTVVLTVTLWAEEVEQAIARVP